MSKLKIRALQIDLARQKENLPYIFSYIDFAKENGYNMLFLYLENAIRTKSTSFFNEDDTYSEEEILQIVEYGTSKNIDVIPALETLGHLEKFLAYPELAHLGEKDYLTLGRGFGYKPTCGCLSNPKLYEFLDNYLIEVSQLFTSEYIHVGLDETFDFLACEKCQERIKNGETAKSMFFDHIMHVYNLCKSLGKRMMMWDDYFEYYDIVHEVPRDIIMCNWNYMFMSDQPLGHWTNRIAKDWFALYDELGIEYIFCGYAHKASSTYALDTFYDYAMRRNPLGGLMTAWERSKEFYLAAYPCIAYWGRLMAGLITKEEKIDVYAEMFDGDKELAQIITSLNIVDAGGYSDITKMCETDYLIKRVYKDNLEFVLPKIKICLDKMNSGRGKDIVTEIYIYIMNQYLQLLMQKNALDYFEGRDRNKILDSILLVKNNYKILKEYANILWAKYRKDIKSAGNQFDIQFNNRNEKLEKLSQAVLSEEQFGILYVELMLPEAYGTPRNKITVLYEDGEEQLVFEGVLKPTVVYFECGGCFQYRFAIKPKKIKKLVFSARGEGGTYPTFFRYTIGNNIYVTGSVNVVEGHVINEHKLLRNDSRFAEMGNDDGVLHALDLSLCKQKHTIELTFKKLD